MSFGPIRGQLQPERNFFPLFDLFYKGITMIQSGATVASLNSAVARWRSSVVSRLAGQRVSDVTDVVRCRRVAAIKCNCNRQEHHGSRYPQCIAGLTSPFYVFGSADTGRASGCVGWNIESSYRVIWKTKFTEERRCEPTVFTKCWSNTLSLTCVSNDSKKIIIIWEGGLARVFLIKIVSVDRDWVPKWCSQIAFVRECVFIEVCFFV